SCSPAYCGVRPHSEATLTTRVNCSFSGASGSSRPSRPGRTSSWNALIFLYSRRYKSAPTKPKRFQGPVVHNSVTTAHLAGGESVMVPTFTVDVAMGDFFFAGVTHADNLDLEIEALTSERMIAIDDHVITFHVADGDNLHTAVRAGSVELHAHFQFVDTLEHGAVKCRNQLGAVFAVGVLRLDGDLDLIPALLAFQG